MVSPDDHRYSWIVRQSQSLLSPKLTAYQSLVDSLTKYPAIDYSLLQLLLLRLTLTALLQLLLMLTMALGGDLATVSSGY